MQDRTEDLTSAARYETAEAPSKQGGWFSRWKRTLPLGAVGGVVAAGVVLALFMTNNDGLMKRSHDETGLMSLEIADRYTSNAASSKNAKEQTLQSDGSESMSNGSLGRKSDEPLNQVAPVAPGTPSPEDKGDFPQASGSASPGSASSQNVGPTASASVHVDQSGKPADGVSISAPLRFGAQEEPSNTDSNVVLDTTVPRSLLANPGPANPSPEPSSSPAPTNSILDGFRSGSGGSGGGNAGETAKSVESGAADKGGELPGVMGLLTPPDPGLSSLTSNASSPVVSMKSPDKQLVAIYNTQTRRVVVAKSADEQAIVFTSGQQWTEKDLILLNGWLSATTISYTVTQGDVKKSFMIDLERKLETAVTP